MFRSNEKNTHAHTQQRKGKCKKGMLTCDISLNKRMKKKKLKREKTGKTNQDLQETLHLARPLRFRKHDKCLSTSSRQINTTLPFSEHLLNHLVHYSIPWFAEN